MSIFKETFKDFVFRQLRIREAIVQTGNDGSTRFGNPRSEIQVGSNTENIAIAKGANRTISFTLSDSFCVSRHKDEWIDLIQGQVDILFGNEDEIKELSGYGTLTEAAQWIQGKVKVACLTLAERGSIIVTEDEIIGVGAKAVSQVIDSTGAGDLYASGFLFGYARGLDLKICGELASIAAAEIITHTGARPLVPLKSLIESEFRN